MRDVRLKKITARSLALTKIAGSPTRWLALIVAVLIGSVLLVAAVRAYNRVMPNGVNVTKPSALSLLVQGVGKPSGKLQSGLSFQPEADKLRRRLGQRFTKPGRERATLVGTLTIGVQQLPVRIVRTQNDDGEQVEIALGGGPASLTWNRLDGAKSAGGGATGIERVLIERLALDSPDQFVLAQVRGAAYYTVARQVRPVEAGSLDDYDGPVWDVVRIGERQDGAPTRPQSLWRLYYINSSTGFIDKVVSREGADTILAEVSDWVERGGESVPTRIRWIRAGQVVMELSLTNVAHGSGQ
ncbi:MAG: hypothetical protein AABO57_19305 [Acidobacteriota bacterium]